MKTFGEVVAVLLVIAGFLLVLSAVAALIVAMWRHAL